MKIGILTQPLSMNYGGLLQAFALQHVLKENGHEVWVINRYPQSHLNILRKIQFFLRYVFLHLKNLCTKKESFLESLHYIRDYSKTSFVFSKKYITPCSQVLWTDRQLKRFIANKKFDAYVVGSDQVWRPMYSPNIYTYFLDFLNQDKKVKTMAYAASFGVDQWEFSSEQTKKCQSLIKNFQYVSTREYSGIVLCRDYLKRNDVEWVLDPTFLLSTNVYKDLVRRAGLNTENKRFLVTYILDETQEKTSIVTFLSKELGLSIYNASVGFPEMEKRHFKGKASVEEWLYGFINADFAIVDSFHGCVFSLILHIPFYIIRNEMRGNARFDSLVKLFNIENRYIDAVPCTIKDLPPKEMDWEIIDSILLKEKEKSFNFLSKLWNPEQI